MTTNISVSANSARQAFLETADEKNIPTQQNPTGFTCDGCFRCEFID